MNFLSQALYALIGKVSGRIRVTVWRLILGRDAIAASVLIQSGVRLRATDGGTIALAYGVGIDRYADVTVKYGSLEIGAHSYIGQCAVICARDAISIGSNCLIAEHVSIRDQDHRFGPGLITAHAGFTTNPIQIGDNVWIGAHTTVTRGVTIGDNVVVGANSVVTRDIPANSVAVGAPARVIRALRMPA
ncbi:MAG: acyltransferase [Oceanospirillales bacterium]|nr:acyltransferase [Oceanospirillales bacterium]